MMLQNVVFYVTIRISPTSRVLTRYYFPSVVTFLLPFTFTSTGFLRSSPAGRSPRQGSDAGVPRGRAHRGAGTGARARLHARASRDVYCCRVHEVLARPAPCECGPQWKKINSPITNTVLDRDDDKESARRSLQVARKKISEWCCSILNDFFFCLNQGYLVFCLRLFGPKNSRKVSGIR